MLRSKAALHAQLGDVPLSTLTCSRLSLSHLLCDIAEWSQRQSLERVESVQTQLRIYSPRTSGLSLKPRKAVRSCCEQVSAHEAISSSQPEVAREALQQLHSLLVKSQEPPTPGQEALMLRNLIKVRRPFLAPPPLCFRLSFAFRHAVAKQA